ncbi:MAG: hypothetical protein FJ145_00220 [Deltaproteobacteria bacterium]|nr:hypothetical protein [Deltaproteobacteria bacterium]
MLVASEFPFKDIIGVEMSPVLAEYAARNATIIRRRFPDRTRINIVAENAVSYKPAAERTICFYYHAFGRETLEAFIKNLERRLGETAEHVFFIYSNPVYADVVDTSSCFARWSAEKVPYESREVGFGPDTYDCAVIWQSLPEQYPPLATAKRHVQVVRRTRAELDD